MRLLRVGFVAALMMAFCGYGAASAATIDPGQKAQGMKEAPALLQAAGVQCDVADAYFVGSGSTQVNGKAVPSKVYEAACKDGTGYFVAAPQGQTPQSYDCLLLKTASDQAVAKGGKPGQLCTLPENVNPAAGLGSVVAKAGLPPCTVANGRYVGSSPTDKIVLDEARCTDGRGYVMVIPQAGSTKTLMVVSCAEAGLFGNKCALTSDAEVTQQIEAMPKTANPAACQINAARWVLATTDGNHFYEIGCADGKSGYIFEADNLGAVKRVIPCAKAEQVGDGCTLTNADVAKTAEASLYTQQTKQIGYPCTVSKYQTLGSETAATKREIVELACKERSGSVWALLPTGSGGDPVVMNCLRSQSVVGLPSCKLSPMSATYEDLSSQIKTKGKTCTVTNARYIKGVHSQTGEDFVEAACSQGGGFIIAYKPAPIEAVADVFTCKEAVGTTRACILK